MSATGDGPERKFGPPIGAIIGTILGIVAWLVFILLYALDWSKSYDLFQNLVVVIVSFLIAALLISAMWIIWIFSTGRHRYWWSNEDHVMVHNYRRSDEILHAGQRSGEGFAVVVILLIFAFFVYHQVANTGFYTAKFGEWEMFALYGSILFSCVPPLARAVLGARNPVRPLEAASNIFSMIAALFLLTVFPFNFSRFADALPSAVRFAFSWITNDMGKVALMLIILGSLISGVVNIVKFLNFVFGGHVSGVAAGNTIST
jgi:hypothetical protein